MRPGDAGVAFVAFAIIFFRLWFLQVLTGDDYVEVIDWRERKSVRRIVTGKGAHNFLPLGDGRHVLLSNRMANTVSVIDQQRLAVIDTIYVPGGPDCMELSKDGKQLLFGRAPGPEGSSAIYVATR